MLEEKPKIYRRYLDLDNCTRQADSYHGIVRHNKILSLIEECRKHPKDLLDKLEEIRRLVNGG